MANMSPFAGPCFDGTARFEPVILFRSGLKGTIQQQSRLILAVALEGTWLEENGHWHLVGRPLEDFPTAVEGRSSKLMRMLLRSAEGTFKSMEAQLQCLLQLSSSARRLLMKKRGIVTDELTASLRLCFGALGLSTPFWPLLSDADKEVLMAYCQWPNSFKIPHIGAAFAWLERGDADQTHQPQSHIGCGWFRIAARRAWPPPGFVFYKGSQPVQPGFEEGTLLRVLEEDGERLLVQQVFDSYYEPVAYEGDPLCPDPKTSATWIQRELTLQICLGDEVEVCFDFDPGDLRTPGQVDTMCTMSPRLGVRAIRGKVEKDQLSFPYFMPAWTVLPRLHCAVLGGSIPPVP